MNVKGIGKKIREAMIEASLTQAQLAQKLGLKQQSISKWITETNDLTVSTLKKISEATNKPLQYFFDNSIDNNNGNIIIGDQNFANSLVEIQLLKAEIELLKKEIELLKKRFDNTDLKMELIKKK